MPKKKRRKIENRRTCKVCNVDVHRVSMQKHLRSKKHLENEKQNELIIPEWLFKEEQTLIEIKIRKIYNPKALKQLARENIKFNDKELYKELAKKMNNLYYFTDRNLKVGFNINLDSHHINHANSKITITPNYHKFAIEICYIKEIVKKLSVIYARLKDQYIFKYQTVFSAKFDKQVEDNQV